MYSIKFSRDAAKYYKRCDTKTKRILNKCFVELQNSPQIGPNVKPLHGELEGLYRYRNGDLRIIYQIVIPEIMVYIVAIGSRGDI